MKIPTFAALCVMATMTLGSGKEGKAEGTKEGLGSPALIACQPTACAKGAASHAKVVAGVKKVIPDLSATPKDCMKQLEGNKDKLKAANLQATHGKDTQAYSEACKDEIAAAHKGKDGKGKDGKGKDGKDG